ncbi:MAG TPA: DinB family protein [Opitutaceae bacterium]
MKGDTGSCGAGCWENLCEIKIMKLSAVVSAALFGLGSILSASASESTESLFESTFLWHFDDASGKVVSLAKAIPEDKYDWRPAGGIRSVREVVLHTAAANYFLGSMLGATIPKGVNAGELEKSMLDKQASVAALEKSIAFARAAVAGVAEEDLGTKINLFGQEAPKMSAVFVVGAHANEHLGQLIAYARSNGVAPPWSK